MNGEDILSFGENDGSSDVTDEYCDASDLENIAGDAIADPSVTESVGDGSEKENEFLEATNDREEYEKLIKTRFKELFREDTQRLINKRFKKYKALEEKAERLELEAKKYADIELLLQAERERAVRETEERMNLQFKAMRARVTENAIAPHSSRPTYDVSRLTKSERASLASRALRGEKIHL